MREPSAKYLVQQTACDVPDWRVVKLGAVATFRTGPFGSALHKSDYVSGGVPVINPMQIEDGRIKPTERMSVAEEAAERLSEFRLRSGDVVIGRRGEMGRCAFVQEEQDGWLCGTGSMIVRPSVLMEGRFLQRVLSSNQAVRAIESASVGTTMINLNQRTLAELDLQIPISVDEQSSIADALADADALIDSLEQLLTKKQQIKQGAMQELLTGKRRLPGFAGLVQTVQLGSVCKMQSGGTPAASQSAYFDGPHPWVAISDITQANKYLSTTERSLSDAGLNASAAQLFPAGTVLYAMYASVGECCIATVTSCTSQAILTMQPTKSLDSEYLYYSLVSSKAKAKSAVQQGTQGNLNKGIVQAMDIRLPEIAEQQAIARVLCEMDAEITALESRLTKARALKQAMAQALLTGKIRLI